MTLNITLLVPDVIIQVSDRRMVRMPSGRVYSDQANKGVVLEAEDGFFSITFAGIGMALGKRTDMWLAERLADTGAPELPIEAGVEIIRKEATAWFNRFPPSVDKRHTFVVSGWQKVGRSVRPVLWEIGNQIAISRGVAGPKPLSEFWIREQQFRRRVAMVAFGLHRALRREDTRLLNSVLRADTPVDRVEEVLVQIVRNAAERPEGRNGINGNVLAVGLDKQGVVGATYYPQGAASFHYAPLFVWHRGDKNFIAGDAKMTASGHWGYQIGNALVVGPPSGDAVADGAMISKMNQVAFQFRSCPARYKREPSEDVSLVRAWPISPEAIKQFDEMKAAMQHSRLLATTHENRDLTPDT